MSAVNGSPSVDIEFQDLSYVIDGTKGILKSISGKFCSGELTAILGTSGAGKTTLLNILAGYLCTGVTGSITVNGVPRNMKTFGRSSAYIMQEDLLQPYLSVDELMMIAANLKLGTHISLQEKSVTINEVLKLLGLENCLDTRTESLSGGQKRRLSIALEMVSNPPVIFLDEPTSGLDIVSAKQCLNTVHDLTKQKKTIICTIHQPTASMLQQFDQVYFLHDGICVYNGSASNIIPFMSSLGYECPLTYCPAEYIVDTVQTIQEFTLALSEGIQNGKINRRDSRTERYSSNCVVERLPSVAAEEAIQGNVSKMNANSSTSFWTQFRILSYRMFLQIKRNKLALWIQLINHLIAMILLASLYYGVGNNASKAVFSFNFYTCVLTFFLYTYMMIPVVSFPSEIQLLRREYFNGWYDLKPYFLALTLRSLPIMMVLGLALLSVTYVLTDQPLEVYRFIWFATICILTGVVSESLGVVIGSTCSLTNGSVLAPAIGVTWLLFCVHGMGYGSQVNSVVKVLLHSSYLRIAIIAICNALYGSRSSLDCNDDIYCYYQDPKRFLKDLGVQDEHYELHLLGLVVFAVVFRLIGFLALKWRLTYEFSQIIVNYANKIFRHS